LTGRGVRFKIINKQEIGKGGEAACAAILKTNMSTSIAMKVVPTLMTGTNIATKLERILTSIPTETGTISTNISAATNGKPRVR
jgi:hypothetical protein